MSVCLSVTLSICLFSNFICTQVSVCLLYYCPFASLAVCLSPTLPVCLSPCLFVCPSVYLSAVYQPVCSLWWVQ
jgi:hypothetical protein